VRQLLEGLPETDETAALDMTSRLWTMQFGWRLGISDDEATELFERGLATAERRGDPTMRSMFHAIYGTTSSMKGKVERAEAEQREALRIADETGDPMLRVAMRPGASYVYFMRGLLADALREVEIGIEIGREDPSLGRGLGVTSPYAFCEMFRGGLLTNLGRLEEAASQLELADRVTRKQGDFEAETWNYSDRVQHDWIRGEPEAALSHATRGIELGERIGDVFSRSWVRSWLAIALQLNGRLEEGIAEMEESLRMSSESGTGLDSEPWRLAWLADMLGEAGDHQRAMETADRALALCLERGVEGSRPQIQWTRARVLAGARGRDGVAEARAAVDESLEIGRRIGYGFGIYLNEVEYAKLARLEGDEAAAERHLREAQRGFAEIGATGRAGQIEEQLAAPA
jgi:tetratricopeptide (TPR) repeat protein